MQEAKEMILTLTERAASKAKKLMEKEDKPGYGLRIGVVSGGCSGYMYDIALEKAPKKDDNVFEDKGIRIFVSPQSAEFMKGSEVDYLETLQHSGFKINNPNVKTSCGCGHSVG